MVFKVPSNRNCSLIYASMIWVLLSLNLSLMQHFCTAIVSPSHVLSPHRECPDVPPIFLLDLFFSNLLSYSSSLISPQPVLDEPSFCTKHCSWCSLNPISAFWLGARLEVQQLVMELRITKENRFLLVTTQSCVHNGGCPLLHLPSPALGSP